MLSLLLPRAPKATRNILVTAEGVTGFFHVISQPTLILAKRPSWMGPDPVDAISAHGKGAGTR